MNNSLLSPCGLYCGVCSVYIAHKTNNLDLKRTIFPIFQQWGAKNIEDITCEGCMSKGYIFSFCQTCSIKNCIKHKLIDGCWKCDEFPCKIIHDWPSPEGKIVIIDEIKQICELGIEKWVQKVEETHKCSKCGTQLYRGAQNCYVCHNLI